MRGRRASARQGDFGAAPVAGVDGPARSGGVARSFDALKELFFAKAEAVCTKVVNRLRWVVAGFSYAGVEVRGYGAQLIFLLKLAPAVFLLKLLLKLQNALLRRSVRLEKVRLLGVQAKVLFLERKHRLAQFENLFGKTWAEPLGGDFVERSDGGGNGCGGAHGGECATGGRGGSTKKESSDEQ